MKNRAKHPGRRIALKVGLRIRERRQELGYTQEELRLLAGCSREVVARVELDPLADIRLSTLTRLAQALKTRVVCLVD